MGADIRAGASRRLLHYRLSLPDGTEIVSTFDAEPLWVTLGAGDLHPALERIVVTAPLGERFVRPLPVAEGFGAPDPELEQDVALADFPPETPAEVGALMEFTLPDGTRLSGVVKSVDAGAARVDFNHPLAGCDVVLELEVLQEIE